MESRSEVEKIQEALKTLNLSSLVSLNDIKKRYRELSKKFHPDLNSQNSQKFREINEAYKILKDYIENYRFTFSKEEIIKQFPREYHASKFRF